MQWNAANTKSCGCWALGKRTEEVREATGYSLRWIRVIANRYNQQGEAGVGDGRHRNCGADPLLDEVEQAQLLQAIVAPVDESGLWNGRKVADWMSRVIERPVAPSARVGIPQADGVSPASTAPRASAARPR